MSSSSFFGVPRRSSAFEGGDQEVHELLAAQTAAVPAPVVRTWPARAVLATAAVLPALAVTALLGGSSLPVTVLGSWSAVALVRAAGTRRVVEAGQQMASDLRITALFGGPIALAAVFGVVPLEAARASLLVVGVAAASMAVVRWMQPRGLTPRRVVLVGNGDEVHKYCTTGLGHDVVAGCLALGGDGASMHASLVPTTTSLDSLPGLASRVDADSILVLPGVDVTSTVVRELTWLFEDSPVTVGVICPVASVSAHRLRTTVSGRSTVLELGKPRGTAGSRLTKAVVDRVGAAILGLVTAPLVLLMWAAVRLDSPGPGFSRQTCTGRNGEDFQRVRLRTMHRDAECRLAALTVSESDSESFVIQRDDRVTRLGYWLRRLSIDELPQLFNVLRGEMSLVGPRPAHPDEVQEYDSIARRRLLVKPGMTGPWHVPFCGGLRWDESLRWDADYTDNWRLLDELLTAAQSVAGVTRARQVF